MEGQRSFWALPDSYLTLDWQACLTIKGPVWSLLALLLPCYLCLFSPPPLSLSLPSPLSSHVPGRPFLSPYLYLPSQLPCLSLPLLPQLPSHMLNQLYSVLYLSCGWYLRRKGSLNMNPQRHPVPPHHPAPLQTYPSSFFPFYKTQGLSLPPTLLPLSQS